MSSVDPDDIPLPGDLDDEEESPYLRRQKRLAVRGSRVPGRLRGLLKAALFALTILLPVGYGGYGLASYALTSSRFRLISPEDVEVAGNQYVSREEVLGALGMTMQDHGGRGVSVLRLSLEARKKHVESIPWVLSAAVSRAYPHRLRVDVVERTPVAFVNVGGRVKLVDSEGVWLERPGKAVFDFPVLRGLEARGSVVGPRSCLALYLGFSRQLAGEVGSSGWLLSEVDLADPEDLKALLVQGGETIQVHFGHEDFLQRFHNFLAMLPEVRKTNSRIEAVDLRYNNQIVVKPQPAGSKGEGSKESGVGN